MAEIKDSQLIRDALGSPVPQYWDETSKMYIARTVDGSFADVDFSKVRLLRDKLGSPIPQLWDIETAKFVPGKGGANGEVTIESVPGLKEKLDETTATLADTLKKGQVAVSDIDKNKGLLDQTYLSDTLKQQISGTAPINAVPADKSITTNKFADKAVSPEKTSFIKSSTNLVDFTKLTIGFNFDLTTGVNTADPNASVSGLLEIVAGESYVTVSANRRAFYDASQTFISAVSGNGTFVAPSNAKFIKLSTTSPTTLQLNVGTVAAAYEPYYKPYVVGVEAAELKNDSVTKNKIPDKEIDTNHIKFLESSSNLANKNTFTPNFTLNGATGEPAANVAFHVSAFIPIKASTGYIGNIARWAQYDINKKFISSVAAGSFTSSPIAKFARIVVANASLPVVQFNEGSALAPYEDFYRKFTVESGIQVSIEKEELNLRTADHFTIEDIWKAYESPVLPDVSEASASPLLYKMTADFHAEYDALLAAYPNYITKTVLGTDSTGLPIHRYDFIPSRPGDVSTKFPKVFITTGTHHERNGIWCTLQAMKQICENWKANEHTELLRWNVHFIIIPVLNPWGIDNYQRRNANGVDLNRNFPYNWVAGDPTSQTYGGTAPLSEISSQLVDAIFKANPDIVYYCDFHNYFAAADRFIWNAYGTLYNANLSKVLISKMTRVWKERYPYLPQDDETFLGYTSQTPDGSGATHAVTFGFQSSTFEVGRSFALEQPSVVIDSPMVIRMGVESIINWLSLNLRNNIKLP